jgi:hypothetical protein
MLQRFEVKKKNSKVVLLKTPKDQKDNMKLYKESEKLFKAYKATEC